MKGCCLKREDYTPANKRQWVGSMRALLYKNTLSILRDPSLGVFIFGQAVLLVAICHLVLGNAPRRMLLAVVNHDGASARRDCRGVAPLDNCSLGDLGCQFLLHLHEPMLRKEFHNHLDSAKEAVRRGRAWGVLYVNENFTDSIIKRKEEGNTVEEKAVNDSIIQVWLDMSNQIISWMVYGELKTKYFEFARSILGACNYNPKLAEIPLKMMQPVYGTTNDSFMDSAAPGLIIFINFFFGVALSVLSIVYERLEGLLDRNIVAGVTMIEIMAAHFLTQLLLMLIQVVLFITFGFYVFHIDCVGSMAYVFVITMLQGLCGMCYGFVISSVCKDEKSAIYLAAASMQPMLMLCGILWPLEGMSVTIKWLSELMPLTYPIRALRFVMLRGWGLTYSEVSAGFVLSFVWIAAYLAVTLTATKIVRQQ